MSKIVLNCMTSFMDYSKGEIFLSENRSFEKSLVRDDRLGEIRRNDNQVGWSFVSVVVVVAVVVKNSTNLLFLFRQA